MVVILLICQILIHALFQCEYSTEGLIAISIALSFCTAIAQARWCAIWAKHDDLDMRIERLEEKRKIPHKSTVHKHEF